jgi:hypothetical protein
MTDMARKRRLTDEEYAEMAADYEAHPPTADEVRSIEINPAILRMGRPRKGAKSTGKTPPLAIRLPEPIRIEIAHRVKAGESSSESELVRKAVVEYIERHPIEVD